MIQSFSVWFLAPKKLRRLPSDKLSQRRSVLNQPWDLPIYNGLCFPKFWSPIQYNYG